MLARRVFAPVTLVGAGVLVVCVYLWRASSTEPPIIAHASSCDATSGQPTFEWSDPEINPVPPAVMVNFGQLGNHDHQWVKVRGVLSVQYGSALEFSGTRDAFVLFEPEQVGRQTRSTRAVLLRLADSSIGPFFWLERRDTLSGRCTTVEGAFQALRHAAVIGEIASVSRLEVWDHPRISVPTILLPRPLPPTIH